MTRADMLTVRRYPDGPRVWIARQRLHHGATGTAVAVLGARRRSSALALLGLALCAHDRRDARAWFARETLPLHRPSR